ncbi:MAG: ubiquinone/menaquinone biosynthesis C-methylase UbiE [Cognaticolwellia sp.]|jgi:ubiquinone/menaquinone biosynthesis C-methylase UbiE
MDEVGLHPHGRWSLVPGRSSDRQSRAQEISLLREATMDSTNTWVFKFAASGYDWMTAQDLWRSQIALLLDHVPSPPESVLDLGCGPGVSSFELAERSGAQVVGLDFSERMIELAQARHRREFSHLERLTFQHGDAAALELPDHSVDLVTGHSFLYLVHDRQAVLREIRRVLKPGGSLVLMEPHAAGTLYSAAWQARGQLGLLLQHPLDTARFCTSMALWRVFGNANGMLCDTSVAELFAQVGFTQVHTQPTLQGLGLHCIGRVQ